MNETYRLIWRELLDTEKQYITVLQNVYDMVMISEEIDCRKSFSITQISFTHLKHKLLGNWLEILSFHKIQVLPSLEVCNGNAKLIKYWATAMAPCFVDLYTTYFSLHEKTKRFCAYLENVSSKSANSQKVNVTNEVMENCKNFIGLFKCQLTIPIQRIQSYHLLLEKLQKGSNISDAKCLDDAQQTFNKICNTLNVTMNLRGLTVSPSKLGHFLIKANFSVNRTTKSTLKSRRNYHVILFTDMLLLTKYCVSFKTSISNDNNKSTEDHFPNLDDYMAFFDFSHNTNLTCNKSYEVEKELLLTGIGLLSNSYDQYFSLFTENYESSYIFRANDTSLKQLWTNTISELLRNQLSGSRVNTNRELQIFNRRPVSCCYPYSLDMKSSVRHKTKHANKK
ncbi:dbl related [Schistosoma japonicum]|nr:dbl related [Schistosoma japonicum]KAH8853553.1 dbl related [Schistosoma japonicum]